MAFSITDILSNFQFEGARPTLFNVSITIPQDNTTSQLTQFLVSSTSIPASDLGNIAVPYFGRIVNFAGDRTYQPWNVTIMNDENFAVRNALETWSNLINKRELNTRDPSVASQGYKSTAIVTQLAKTGEALRAYKFNGLYPTSIQPIRLDWNAVNVFESFDVQFTYDWWEISTSGDAGTTGDGGGLN